MREFARPAPAPPGAAAAYLRRTEAPGAVPADALYESTQAPPAEEPDEVDRLFTSGN